MLIFGGTRDDEDLAAYVTLAGERDEDVATFDHLTRRTSTTIRRVPVLTAAQIAQLPFRKVLIIRRGMPAAVGRVQMAWRRRDVRRDQRRRRWATRRAAWAKRVSGWWTVGTQTAREWAAPRLERRRGAGADRVRAVPGVAGLRPDRLTGPAGPGAARYPAGARAAIRALPARPTDTVRHGDGVRPRPSPGRRGGPVMTITEVVDGNHRRDVDRMATIDAPVPHDFPFPTCWVCRFPIPPWDLAGGEYEHRHASTCADALTSPTRPTESSTAWRVWTARSARDGGLP